MKQDLYNVKNEVVGNIEVSDTVFGAKWNPIVVKQVLIAQLANRRKPWAHAKDRSEVRGGGRKPWRQKGTGRARHGSIRSPLWSGGGKAHGPINERDYSQKVNKKMKRAALFSVLSKKREDGEVKFFDTITIDEPKTKKLFALLSVIRGLKKTEKKFDIVIVPSPENLNLVRASHNLMKAKVARPESLNVNDLLTHSYVYIEKGAVPVLEKHFRAGEGRQVVAVEKKAVAKKPAAKKTVAKKAKTSPAAKAGIKARAKKSA